MSNGPGHSGKRPNPGQTRAGSHASHYFRSLGQDVHRRQAGAKSRIQSHIGLDFPAQSSDQQRKLAAEILFGGYPKIGFTHHHLKADFIRMAGVLLSIVADSGL